MEVNHSAKTQTTLTPEQLETLKTFDISLGTLDYFKEHALEVYEKYMKKLGAPVVETATSVDESGHFVAALETPTPPRHESHTESTNPEIEKQKKALSVFFNLLGVTDPCLCDSVGVRELLFNGSDLMHKPNAYGSVSGYDRPVGPMINAEMMQMLVDISEHESEQETRRATIHPETTGFQNKKRLQEIKDAGGIDQIQICARVDDDLPVPGASEFNRGNIWKPSIAFIMKKDFDDPELGSQQNAHRISVFWGPKEDRKIAYENFFISSSPPISHDEIGGRTVERTTYFFRDSDGQPLKDPKSKVEKRVLDSRMKRSELFGFDVKANDPFLSQVIATRESNADAVVPALTEFGQDKRYFTA
ncbi:hypothetical protein FWF74_01235 [Candidatus Saccharibacteria bacterium]|nr:hypothetical protein [Candidatus Saccharibacteria bacterium]MCL1963034.1 hypothetical protein [Candidatus Saccharibacteria bacterium]